MTSGGGVRARRRRRPTEPALAYGLGLGALTLGGGTSLLGLAAARRRRPDVRAAAAPAGARGLYAAAGLLALSVCADSALEHYRGGFRNPGMFAPLAASGATLTVAARGLVDPRPQHGGRLVFAAAAGVGAAGLGFHLFNLLKRPGRLSWLNLFYAAPLGAPAALSLAGGLGLLARAVAAGRRRICGLAAGRLACGITAAGLAGAVGEAGLFHFRGAFQNPFMWLPVGLPPVSATLLACAALEREAPDARPVARGWLALTAALGLFGAGFHAFGVSRAMGGWRNWRQNLIDGPPIPAPPAFSALAVGGLAALALRDAEARA